METSRYEALRFNNALYLNYCAHKKSVTVMDTDPTIIIIMSLVVKVGDIISMTHLGEQQRKESQWQSSIFLLHKPSRWRLIKPLCLVVMRSHVSVLLQYQSGGPWGFFFYLWICPFLCRYSRPSSTSFNTVAMLASSRTPVLCSPREMICLITSSTEPG